MEKTRLTLQTKLEEFLGSRNVYYQPPESIKLKYPCIIYEFSRFIKTPADNTSYLKNKEYTITYIHSGADNEKTETIMDEFSYIDFDRTYKSENLYHDVYTVIW